MNWFFLLLAGICEIGWPLGLKLSETDPKHRLWWLIIAAVAIISSGYFLFLAQRTIPMGTAYAIWTGIGAAGAFIIGVIWFNDPVSFLRIAAAVLLIMGIIGLKLTS